MQRLRLALATIALLATAACSGEPASVPTGQVPTGPVSTEATSTPASSAATPSAPASDCLAGSYRLDRFVGVGASQTFGTGEGGDVSLGFSEDGYTLKGAGQEPIELTLAGGTGNLQVNGAVRGSYTGSGPEYEFTVGDSDGTAALEVGDQRQSLSMTDVANVLAPEGKVTVACNPPKMILLMSSIRLELSRP